MHWFNRSDLGRFIPRNVHWWVLLLGLLCGGSSPARANEFAQDIQPLIRQYCFDCHSTAQRKGDLDLERFTTPRDVLKEPAIWEDVVEKLLLSEMPPASKPQPTLVERDRINSWINGILERAAKARAGDPGPVLLRRLSNAEYTYTVRDLTGVESLDPAREFPADSASGEGFANVGNSLVMSPSMFTKYLDAAKEIAGHVVLLPDDMSFSPSTSQRDWTEEKLAAIRRFYGQFTEEAASGERVLQGVKLDSKDRGILPLERYLLATLEEGSAIKTGRKTMAQVAQDRRLNVKYLSLLWRELNDSKGSILLDQVRAQWRIAKPSDAAAIAESIRRWQQTLWHFTAVGHIGKRDAPKMWQMPVAPLANSREVRLPLPSSPSEITVYLAVSDAGDGNKDDFAVWENLRLVAPGRVDLPLREVGTSMKALAEQRRRVFSKTAACLKAAAAVRGKIDDTSLRRLGQEHDVEPEVLGLWLNFLGLGTVSAHIDSYLTQRLEEALGYDFIKGWTGAESLGVIANSSGEQVRIPGVMKPHGVTVHPSPTRRAVAAWRSPVSARLTVEGKVEDAHHECGNGVTWALELRRGNTRQRLAAGTAHNASQGKFGPLDLAINMGDLITVTIGPRGNYTCDQTAIEFSLTDGDRTWNLAKDVSPNILAGNPHADSHGNGAVWHFYSEPDHGAGPDTVLPTGSLLTKWQSSFNAEEKQKLAGEVQELMLSGPAGLGKDAPDAVLYRQLTALNGSLLSPILRHSQSNRAAPLHASGESQTEQSEWGLDPTRFGKHPNGTRLDENSLCVRAPSVIQIRLPSDLVEGCELVAMGRLDQETGAEGSVQMQMLTSNPPSSGLIISSVQQLTGKKTWTDGEQPVEFETPIIVNEGGLARKRFEHAFDKYRGLFPAALCYTKIVPVDEVITLTLFFREDEHLRRLMLNDSQSAELDRLWSELRYISQDALKLVDAFEQIWQYVTQDGDTNVLVPLREPIKQRAEEFKKLLAESQPSHLNAILGFAQDAYRRPLASAEDAELRGLYGKLRSEGIAHSEAIHLVLARVLVSPAFLYRAEKPVRAKHQGPVDDWELATRLSYFLWSSSPDNELRQTAGEGRLHKPRVLLAQTRRMLRDSRVRRLATEFACSWLHIHDFESFDEKSERHFPTFASLRGPMYEEAIRFFTDVFQNDASVLSFFDADHTFLNPALAEHYGVPGVVGDWQRVDGVKQFGRGGALGMGATLAKHSGASRTSPILRGNWVSEVLLGDKLPRPPKDVPRLPEDEATENLTIRELTQRHSSDPRCYTCHARIDGYGFVLEGFDTIGRSRTRDLGDRSIDVRAKVYDGTMVEGAIGLRDYLVTKKRDVLLNQFCRKLLGYALGRAVMLSDKPLLVEMQTELRKHDYRISAAIETIVRSKQFREIRGKDVASAE